MPFKSITYWRTSDSYVVIFISFKKNNNCREEPHDSGGPQTEATK